MDLDQLYVYLTGLVILGLFVVQMLRRDFDAFAPIWLFLAGYTQVYVIQAISYREYALRVRGSELVTAANLRALWALAVFLTIYYSGLGRRIASRLPSAPSLWSPGLVVGLTPLMILWGLFCSGLALGAVGGGAEEDLLRQFPIMMLAGGILLIVTGRQPTNAKPSLGWIGLLVVVSYILIWMFNGRRSHAIIGVLTGICAWYVPSYRRPSTVTLATTGLCCALVVSLALGWRGNSGYERSASGFVQFVSEFDPSHILVNLNLSEREEGVSSFPGPQKSKETEEYGGFLLMMDTVPHKATYDYGASYLRIFSTYIPRLIWKSKPYFGREEWIRAWIAGSEFPRDLSFTGPAIGILGAAQLNGGAWATVLVMSSAALLLRTGYDYFRLYCDRPWAQFWWAITYYVAWLMTVNDDPLVWFYYIYGHTTLPPVVALWVYLRVMSPGPSTASA